VLRANSRALQSSELPSELNEVVVELKKILNYKTFSLSNTMVVRAQDGGPFVSTDEAGSDSTRLYLRIEHIGIAPGETAPVLQLGKLIFRVFAVLQTGEGKEGSKGGPAELATSINVPVGQKVVVGKTSLGSPDEAYILVMTAKVLD